MNADRNMVERMWAIGKTDGDQLTDLHLWRLGPGHLAAIISVTTQRQRGPEHCQLLLGRFRALSHVTVQVRHQ
jgi:Co/Zn/Cd efflux system component